MTGYRDAAVLAVELISNGSEYFIALQGDAPGRTVWMNTTSGWVDSKSAASEFRHPPSANSHLNSYT